jgi:hypothetical protein
VAASNRGGWRARAGPDGEKQTTRRLEARLDAPLVWDVAPLSDDVAECMEQREMANGEREALAYGRRVENILASMLNARRG